MFKRLFVAASALLLPSLALAADPIAIPIDSTGRSIPLTEGSSDWSGFYAGVYGVGRDSDDTGTQLGLGVSAGANAQIDFVLVGAEVRLQGLTGDTVDTAYGQLLGRAGLVLNDDVLLYAAAGYGLDLSGDAGGQLFAGGGVELAVNEDVSVNAEYLRSFEGTVDGATNQFTLGARFHF